jgi:dTDP-4-dehydrorhamnose 3,5-epimerase
MHINPTRLGGVFEVTVSPHADERGLFARLYDEGLFRQFGLHTSWPQRSVSFNPKRGTLRGLHYQADPHPEIKLVRCTRGNLFDVVVDLRPQSATFCKWIGVELSADRRNALYIPAGCAHGFLTLQDNTEVDYQIGTQYHAELARGVRWNDLAFGIGWPFHPFVISERDAHYPDVAV